jgi:hypothetical protein
MTLIVPWHYYYSLMPDKSGKKGKENLPPPLPKNRQPMCCHSSVCGLEGFQNRNTTNKFSSRVKIYPKYKLINTYSVNKILKQY